jgi:parvulin-like peptidyl-prolyl isomerase
MLPLPSHARSTATRGVILALMLAAAVGAGLRAEVIEQVLVKVNGEIFTKTDLENRQIARIREIQGQRVDLSTDNQELRKLLDQLTPSILVDAVDEMLVVQRGKELGYTLADEQFQSVLQNIRTQNKLEDDEQFEAALKQEGLTLADLRRNLERQMIWQRVQQNEVVNRVALTEEEARAYYDSHLSEFTTPAAVTLREILIATPADSQGVNVAADDAAQERISAIRLRALKGESFETLATELSDSPSRANAGLVGPIRLADLSADLRKIIEGMKVGDVSQPLRTPRGYQLLKLESSTPEETTPFEEAREQIAEGVLTGKREREFFRYLERLRMQAIIEWKNPEIQRAYEQGLEQQAASLAAAPSN